MDKLDIYIGFDPREATSYSVCKHSIQMNHVWKVDGTRIQIHPIVLDHVREQKLYNRIHDVKDGQLYDRISDAPMSTEFAITRFLVPELNRFNGFAVFMDSDMILRADIADILHEVEEDPGKAVYCVKHSHNPKNAVKMDGVIQTLYKRKNWSSVMVFDCSHEKHQVLPELVNTVPGRDLHAFSWLEDDEIGELSKDWNYLVGHTELGRGVEPKIVHWTDGSPEFPDYRNAEYSNEWFALLKDWVRL